MGKEEKEEDEEVCFMVIVVCISPSGPKGNVNLHGVNIFQLLVEREPDSPCHCLIINS